MSVSNLIFVLICLSFQNYGASMHPDRSKRLTMLNDNGRSKQRIINANDLSNVFSKVSPPRKEIKFSYTETEENYPYNDEEDDDPAFNDSPKNVRNEQESDEDSSTYSQAPSSSSSRISNSGSDGTKNVDFDKNAFSETGDSNEQVFNDSADSGLGDEYDAFMNLDGGLDKTAERRISNQLAMDESYEVLPQNQASPRVFQYEPIAKIEINPMAYGAYRRAKLPPTPTSATEGSSKSGRKNKDKKKGPKNDTNSFYDAIKNLGSGPGSSGSGSITGLAEPPPGKKPILPRKAPTEKKRRKIVTPDEINSIFSKKNSDDSNELFPSSSSEKSSRVTPSNRAGGAAIGVSADSDSDAEDVDADESESSETSIGIGGFAEELGQKFAAAYAQAMGNVEDRSATPAAAVADSERAVTTSADSLSMSSSVGAFDSESSAAPVDKFADLRISGDDQIPKWLIKADREAEKKKKEALQKGRKKKQLTDDWRFWLAIIATAGFASAAYNMYQQTGGFDPDISPFSSFGFGPNDGSAAGGGGDELII